MSGDVFGICMTVICVSNVAFFAWLAHLNTRKP